MEKKRQNIDNFFKENLSGFELSKKEGNWELLNHLLDEQEKKKKKRIWFFLIFCFLIITTSGLLVFLPEKKSGKNNEPGILQSNESHPADNNSLKNSSGKSITTMPPVKNEVDRDAKNKGEERESGNNSLVNQEANSSQIGGVKKETTHSFDQENTTGLTVISHAEINSNAQPPAIPHNNSSQTSIDQASNSESPVVNQLQLEDTATSNSSLKQISYITATSTDSLNTKSVSTDSLSAETNDSTADSSATKSAQAKKHILNINFYIGANIYSTSSAFINHENISPIGGVELVHSFNSKFSVGLAGLYSIQGGYHLDDTAVVSQKTYFLDVSENVSQQTIQNRQLQKLYFPLTLYYAIATKHVISGAIQLGYLLNTKGNYTEKNTIAGVTSQSQKNNVKGYMDGIRSINIAVSLGYQFRLSETFDISAHITRELKEAYIKEYFYGVNNNPAWTFQTFLIIKF
jgi:hypothetical protein